MSVPHDPLNFIPADLFFPSVPGFNKPRDVVAIESSESIKKTDPLRFAAHVTLAGVNGDPQTHCLIQFVTPLIWRIRYDPKYTSLADFEDTNTYVNNSNLTFALAADRDADVRSSGTSFPTW